MLFSLVTAAAASLAMLVALLATAAGVLCSTVKLQFLHTTAFGARNLIAMFPAFGTRRLLPNMLAAYTFKNSVFHYIIASLNNNSSPFH
jgi:tetrahydromethanopterin S-methyltransferase subunit E